MSVHGYRADMSIFCNLQLGLLELQEDTPQAVSLAGILQGAVGLTHFAAVEIGFYAQCWSCFSELDVGWSEPFLFIFNGKTNYGNHKLELTSHCLTSDWQLKDCDTFCSMAYIFKGNLNNIRKWLFVFENIID